MLGRDSGTDWRTNWRFPVGASLCAVGGVGNPMPMDLLGGHTLGSMTVSAVALGVFVAGTVWMFRRWGQTGGGPQPATLAEDESDAIWAELEEQLGRQPVADADESEVHEPV